VSRFETGEMIVCPDTVNLGCGRVSNPFWEVEMTTSEQKVLVRGVAAGTIVGLAVGLMIALFIAIRPDLFRALIP
jgi:hypothetical protein